MRLAFTSTRSTRLATLYRYGSMYSIGSIMHFGTILQGVKNNVVIRRLARGYVNVNNNKNIIVIF
jgi:hypothetical protein